MAQFLALIKPFILRVASHPQTKVLVFQLLERLVKTTDNSIDDAILETVKKALFTNQETGEIDTRFIA